MFIKLCQICKIPWIINRSSLRPNLRKFLYLRLWSYSILKLFLWGLHMKLFGICLNFHLVVYMQDTFDDFYFIRVGMYLFLSLKSLVLKCLFIIYERTPWSSIAFRTRGFGDAHNKKLRFRPSYVLADNCPVQQINCYCIVDIVCSPVWTLLITW